MTKEKLKPCPFCGGKPKFEKTITEVVVKCNKCRARIVRLYRTPLHIKQAISAWNRRIGETEYQYKIRN